MKISVRIVTDFLRPLDGPSFFNKEILILYQILYSDSACFQKVSLPHFLVKSGMSSGLSTDGAGVEKKRIDSKFVKVLFTEILRCSKA